MDAKPTEIYLFHIFKSDQIKANLIIAMRIPFRSEIIN